MPWYDTPIRPYDPVIEYDQDNQSIRYYRESFFGNGQNSFATPPAQPQDSFTLLQNCMPVVRGGLDKRWGYTLKQTLTAAAQFSFEYQNDTHAVRRLLFPQQFAPGSPSTVIGIEALSEDASIYNTNIFTGILANGFNTPGFLPPRMTCSRDYSYFGVPVAPGFTANPSTSFFKWDGGYSLLPLTYMGANVDAFVNNFSFGGGAVTLVSGRVYFAVLETTSGNISNLGPVSVSTGALNNAEIHLQINVLETALHGSIDVTNIILLATADGGDQTTLYEVTTIPFVQGTFTYTYTDNTPELTLLASNTYQEQDAFGNNFGVADNSPPPGSDASGQPLPYIVNHNGRLFIAGQQSLFFSKSLAELTTSTGTIAGKWEECWPASYVMVVSTDAETVTGLISDGVSLFIGTNQHIRRVTGDGPSGTNPFVSPQIIFNDIGVANQEVWQKVYIQGTPAGMIWLTPNLRIIGSDFNSYKDIGTPIQDVLNTIDTTQFNVPGACFAQFLSSGPYDIYVIVAPVIGGGYVTLMYDLRAQQWHTWSLVNQPSTLLFNVSLTGTTNWYFVTGQGLVRFDPSLTTDNGTAITTIAQTAWLHFGMPTDRKWLNEIEVIGDSATKVAVEGADRLDSFLSAPTFVKPSSSLTFSPLKTYKLFLANSPAIFRYYRLTFTAASTVFGPFLGAWNAEVIPIHKL